MMRQLDAERVDMRHLKQQLLAAKGKLTQDESKLHADEEDLQTHMRSLSALSYSARALPPASSLALLCKVWLVHWRRYMKQRMENLALLGDQVKERSARVADLYRALQQEKVAVQQYRERLIQAEQSIASMATETQNKAANIHEFEVQYESKRDVWLKDRQAILQEKEMLALELNRLKAMFGISSVDEAMATKGPVNNIAKNSAAAVFFGAQGPGGEGKHTTWPQGHVSNSDWLQQRRVKQAKSQPALNAILAQDEARLKEIRAQQELDLLASDADAMNGFLAAEKLTLEDY